MSKARRQVQENLKYVDFVIELVDARLPISSRNPMLGQIIGDKPRIIALNKADLADSSKVAEWIEYFDEQGFITLAINSRKNIQLSD
ncbi:Ribosome biogenesis GTPase A [Lactococcus lactis]|nr:Ribosome biogenesis GTPase A [Lactococcus lactis]